jgi:hypothetical protein
MRNKAHWLIAAAFVMSAPLAAQTAAKENAVNAVEAPVTASLNNQVDAHVAAKETSVDQQNADAQAQYAADKEAYWAALRANHREVAATDAHYLHQQDAYAAAMRDWRLQVAACKHGHQRACDMPTPDPAAYM